MTPLAEHELKELNDCGVMDFFKNVNMNEKLNK